MNMHLQNVLNSIINKPLAPCTLKTMTMKL